MQVTNTINKSLIGKESSVGMTDVELTEAEMQDIFHSMDF